MSMTPIQFENVNFSYGAQQVLQKFSFEIPSDQLIGMVGVNGSGKSTLLKLILGLLSPQKGEIKVCGEKAGAGPTKTIVGSTLQDIDFPSTEKVREVLDFVCAQFENPCSISNLVEDFQLKDFVEKGCGQLSGGMKRRLALACAFAGNPKIVLLDEPTTGLDKESRKKLMENLKKYQARNKALVLMISHHPDEVVNEVHQFYHLKNQRITPVSTQQMKQSMSLRRLTFLSSQSEGWPQSLSFKRSGEEITVVTNDSDAYLKKLVQASLPFRNLMVYKLGVDELLGEYL